MRILIAPDSLKGSLASPEVAAAMAAGVRAALPDAEVVPLPVGDGGEGSLAALVAATGARTVTRRVTGPVGDPVEAAIALLPDGETAFIEMAQASGLSRVAPECRRAPAPPLTFSAFHTGKVFYLIRKRQASVCGTRGVGLTA